MREDLSAAAEAMADLSAERARSPVAGGQGREAFNVAASGWICAVCLVALVALALIGCAAIIGALAEGAPTEASSFAPGSTEVFCGAFLQKSDKPVIEVNESVYEITFYTPGPESCGRWSDGFTATGTRADFRRNICAADWSVFPPGTRLRIGDLGVYTVEDRGGAIKGRRLDVLVGSVAEARRLGRQRLEVRRLLDE